MVEILTVYLYAIMRVDLRFHVPNGAKGPGSYAAGVSASESRKSNEDVERQDPKDTQQEDDAEEKARKDSMLDGQRRLNSLKEKTGQMDTLKESSESLAMSRKSLYTKEQEEAISKRISGPWDKQNTPASFQ